MADLIRQIYYGAKHFPALRAIARLPILAGIKQRIFYRIISRPANYKSWIDARVWARRVLYPARNEPGLLSFLTTVWNTPVEYLRIVAESLLHQAKEYEFEWVLLDNGSVNEQTKAYLQGLAVAHPQIQFHRAEQNMGIVGGMRFCLEHATGRYVLPLDSDDWLYPDCLRIMIWHIQQHGYPPLLYSDEDKLLGRQRFMPFLKPDWDPILFVNACYIAHLCAFDRQQALELGVYSDSGTEGCHDWDTFFRFWLAGQTPRHVPEIVYSWRLHKMSTAQNISSKSFIHHSHRLVLQRYLDLQHRPDHFELVTSPLFNGTPDWWIRRRHVDSRPLLSLVITDNGPGDGQAVLDSCEYSDHRTAVAYHRDRTAGLMQLAREQAKVNGLLCLISDQVRIESPEWPWEALGLMQRHPDTAVVGGIIRNSHRTTKEAGRYFGFADGLGCPDRGRPETDPGYLAMLWKHRSVSAVSSQFCVFDAIFLLDLLQNACPPDVCLEMLGAWAGAHALRTGRRVVYSPFLQAVSDEDWQARTPAGQRKRFLRANADLLPDTRYYAPLLSLSPAEPFQPIDQIERNNQEWQLTETLKGDL